MEESRDRISFSHIFDGVLKVLNFERGLLLTIRELFLHPGKMIHTYFSGERKKYTHPVQFSVMLVGISAFLTKMVFDKTLNPEWQSESYNAGHKIGSQDQEVDPEVAAEVIAKSSQFMESLFQYINVFTLLFIPITAVLSYWVYKKAKLYYTEHLVLNAYVTGMVSLISIVTMPLYFIAFNTATVLGLFISFVYSVWAYMDIFKEKNVKGGVKASVVTALSFILIMLISIVIGIIFAAVMIMDAK